MPSPFPGMDPFLEAQGFWPDFHASFVIYWRDALAERLPDNYEVRIDERVMLTEHEGKRVKRVGPDLSVSRLNPADSTAPAAATATISEVKPETIPLAVAEEHRQTSIKILHRPDRTLITVLELLSPSNKEEPGLSLYTDKRNALLMEPVHLVEVDLLLAGQRPRLGRDYPEGDYMALVARVEQRFECSVYTWGVRRELPTIPVPLRAPDPDVPVDLAEVFRVTYERGRYARSIDYRAELKARLDEADLAWARETAVARS